MKDARLGMLVMLAMASGCGGSSSSQTHADMGTTADQSTAQNGVNFSQIQQVMAGTCALAGCHAAFGAQGGLNLQTDPYAALVNVPSVNLQAHNEGKVRVKPCDPTNSYLIIKLNLPVADNSKSENDGYGAHMPKDLPSLPADVIQEVSDWIARGALKDEPNGVTGHTCTIDGGVQ